VTDAHERVHYVPAESNGQLRHRSIDLAEPRCPEVIAAARCGLAQLKLRDFVAKDETEFGKRLGKATRALMSTFPEGGQSWGGARKALNIFLRDVVYNTDVSTHFNLRRIRRWLEVPLDSYTAKGLRREPGGDKLPAWKGVKRLQPEDSKKFQRFALQVAEEKRVMRVDLDVFYFRAASAYSRTQELIRT
jgi:hypothetical protein